MSKRLLVGVFDNERDTLDAVRASRARGLRVVDVYGPYAIHGIEDAMGLAPSRIPRFVFVVGLLAAALKVWFEFWTTAVDWPVNVGGKPYNSLPAFVPVTFEVMVLFAGLSAFFAFLVVCRLYPGKRAAVPVAGVTDNRFAVVLEQTDSRFNVDDVKTLLRGFNAVGFEEQLVSEAA